MKKDDGFKIRLGLFVTVAIAIFTIAIYYVGNRQNMFGSNIKVYSHFNNVNGLQAGNNVRFSGINIGTVSAVEILSDSLIEVEMLIDEDAKRYLKIDALTTIGSDGLMGNMLINISPGAGTKRPIEDGDLLNSYSRINTDEILSTLNVSNENIALLTKDLLEITGNINKGEGTLAAFISDTVFTRDIRLTLEYIRQSSYQSTLITLELRDILREFKEGGGITGALLSDTSYVSEMEQIMSNLNSATAKMDTSATKLNDIFSEIQGGQGIATAIIKDSVMANDLRLTLSNIREDSEALGELIEGMKHSWPVRGYFKKEAKEEAKKATDEGN